MDKENKEIVSLRIDADLKKYLDINYPNRSQAVCQILRWDYETDYEVRDRIVDWLIENDFPKDPENRRKYEGEDEEVSIFNTGVFYDQIERYAKHDYRIVSEGISFSVLEDGDIAVENLGGEPFYDSIPYITHNKLLVSNITPIRDADGNPLRIEVEYSYGSDKGLKKSFNTMEDVLEFMKQ